MSQFFVGATSGGGTIPPSVAQAYNVDLQDLTVGPAGPSSGTVIAQANLLRVAGDNGIKTVQTSNPGDLQIRFIRDSTVTSGAVTSTCLTQGTINNSVLTIQIIVAGIADNNTGIGAYGTAVVKNIGGVASLIGDVDLIVNSDSILAASKINVITSGANLLIQVTGVAGRRIDWEAALPGIIMVIPT